MVSPGPAVVALKVVMDNPREDANYYQERIRREIAVVQQIQHPFILPFLGVVMSGTYTVLVSQYMENGDLLEYLKAKPDANRRSLIIEVADAVNYLHTDAGLVHGDLKCQNVLVSPRGDAQLADFGLSTIVDKSLLTDTTTVGIRQSYTLQFAAPELLSDEAKSPSGKTRSKTTQTDVFAFGRLVLQAFTGTVPWPDLPLHTVVHNVLKNALPERREEATTLGLDDKWWSVCVACWRTAPRERPTMGRVLLELSGTGDRPMADVVSPRKPARTLNFISLGRSDLAAQLKPWSLPSIFTNLKRMRPVYQVAPQLPPANETTADGHATETALSLPEPSIPAESSTTVVECQHCAQPIVGIRYQCATCPSIPHSYDLCAACETQSYVFHDGKHIFFKLPRPVKRAIRSAYPFVPDLYLRPAGLFPDGTRNDGRPDQYLGTVRHRVALCDNCILPIVGKWHRCAYCGKDLCDACEEVDTHNDAHLFFVFKAVLDMDRFCEFTDLESPPPLIPYPVY